jgi:transposase
VEAEDLRRLLSARARLVKERTALSNRAVQLADRNAYKVRRSAFSRQAPWTQLLEAAESWSSLDRFLARQYAEDFTRLHRQIGEMEEFLSDRMKRDFKEISRRLQTIPGIGRINAAALCAQVEDIGRFATARQLCRYLGLTPTVRESGQTRRGGPITKCGNGRLRGYLMQAALQVLRFTQPGDPLRVWYDNIRRRRGWKKARVALMRKLASIVFGVWRHGADYDPAKVRVS